jgi:hypothetical protein
MLYYPSVYPCVVEEGLVRVERRLPQDGEIQVEPGQRVEPDHVVAVARGKVPPVTIDAAGELGVSPGDVVKNLSAELGAAVKANDVLVGLRSGLRRKELRAREEGSVISVDPTSGHLLFQPSAGLYELKAHVAGTVDDIDGRRGVTIATNATRVQAIWGVGGETVGVLRVSTHTRDEDLRPDMIDARAALAVLMAGRTASAEALRKAASSGVKAVVLGSIEETELRSFLTSHGRPAPRWYVAGPDWNLPAGNMTLPFTLIITEGFGRMAMTPEVYTALQACDGREVSLAGATRLRGWLQRPEIVVPMASRQDGRPTEVTPATLRAGVRVRLVDPGRVGHTALVMGQPGLRPAGDGVLSEMVEVELEGGGRRHLPVSNLEVLR